MANRRKTNKQIKKMAKKYPKIFIGLIILVAIVIVVFYILHVAKVITIPFLATSEQQEQHNAERKEDGIVENIKYDDFQVHFLELGTSAAGDSVYIKAGENDILIDAGAERGSASVLETYLNKYVTDGKLEYVISTHAHKDHIAGMVGNVSTNLSSYKDFKNQSVKFIAGDGKEKSASGILAYYQVDTLIDFGNMTNNGDAALTKDYFGIVDYAVSKGTKHYTAGDCFNNVGEAKSSYQLASNISFDILYNYYYFNTSSDENNYSVCTMFNYNDHHFMFTGDLEEDGETKLANYYDASTKEKTLAHCELFKGGHHGSATSSNEVLLRLITPDICCVCCCAGTSEYTNRVDAQFPTQAFIDRIAKYTSRVYITSMVENDELKSMNGTIIVSCNGTNIGLKASNNLIRLKDTTWFNEDIYVKKDSKGYDINCSGAKQKDWFTSETEGATVRKRRVWPSYGVA